MDQYITNNNRPTNLFCTAKIVENLFIVTDNNNILTAELNNLNFHTLRVVSHYLDPQL